MARTLLLGDGLHSWRSWIRESGRPRLNLDPGDSDDGPAARVVLEDGGRTIAWRFVGTLDASRNPIAVLGALARLLPESPPDGVVQTFPVRRTPVAMQMALAVAEAVRPERILVSKGSGLEGLNWPVGPETVEIPSELPRLARDAQRRARWLEMIEATEEHEVDLDQVTTDGARLGSGTPVQLDGVPGHAEVAGSVLHIVTDTELDEELLARAMNLAHASRVSVVSPDAYRGLLCSFVREDGEDFGIGVIEAFDPVRMRMRIRCTAVAPAPVRRLRLGSLRIDETGKELGDVKPWTV